MSDYALDQNNNKVVATTLRTRPNNIQFHCPSPNCNARMTPVLKGNKKPHFKALEPHAKDCPYNLLKGSKTILYNKSEFIFPDTLKYLNLSSDNSSGLNNSSSSSKPIKGSMKFQSLGTIYSVAKEIPPEDMLGNAKVSDFLVDNRVTHLYTNGIENYKVFEGTFFRFDNSSLSIYLHYPCRAQNIFGVELKFNTELLFKKIVSEIMKFYNPKININIPVIVALGEWEKVNKTTFGRRILSSCIISSEKQILIMG